jgi:FlaA1/EpsC-like NDP-sugar epimerase
MATAAFSAGLARTRSRPVASFVVNLAFDVIAVSVSGYVAVIDERLAHHFLSANSSQHLWWALTLLFPLFAALRLYPGVIRNPVTELRDIVTGITITFVAVAGTTLLPHQSVIFPAHFILICWLFTMLAVPFGRSLARRAFARRSWWGEVRSTVLCTHGVLSESPPSMLVGQRA